MWQHIYFTKSHCFKSIIVYFHYFGQLICDAGFSSDGFPNLAFFFLFLLFLISIFTSFYFSSSWYIFFFFILFHFFVSSPIFIFCLFVFLISLAFSFFLVSPFLRFLFFQPFFPSLFLFLFLFSHPPLICCHPIRFFLLVFCSLSFCILWDDPLSFWIQTSTFYCDSIISKLQISRFAAVPSGVSWRLSKFIHFS